MNPSPVRPVPNVFRRDIQEDSLILGTILSSTRNPDTVRMAAAAGFDFVWVDLQHSSMTLSTAGDMCAMARACGLTPIVRPDTLRHDRVRRLLDSGAMGIVFFDVQTPDQARAYADWVREPPESAVARDYVDTDQDALDAHVLENLAVVLQVESAEAVGNVDSILDACRPDAVQIGRSDLSRSLGVPHRLRDPKVLSAVDAVVAAAAPRHITIAAGAYGDEDATDLYRRGVRCFHYGTDSALLLSSYRAGVRLLRDLPARR